MKALIDARSDRMLGFTMLGSGAGEVIAAVQSAMLAGLAYTGLGDAILTHSTMAEGLSVLLAGVPAMTETTRPTRRLGGVTASPKIFGARASAQRPQLASVRDEAERRVAHSRSSCQF